MPKYDRTTINLPEETKRKESTALDILPVKNMWYEAIKLPALYGWVMDFHGRVVFLFFFTAKKAF
jgi:hypothetical protein